LGTFRAVNISDHSVPVMASVGPHSDPLPPFPRPSLFLILSLRFNTRLHKPRFVSSTDYLQAGRLWNLGRRRREIYRNYWVYSQESEV